MKNTLTERDITRIIKRVINEENMEVNIPMVWELSKKLGLKYSTPMGPDQVFFHYGDNASLAKQQIFMDIINNKPMTITVQDERGVKEFRASTPIDKIVDYVKGSKNYKKLTDSEPKDVREQDETTAVTPTLPKEKVHPIKPTEYENVKRMIQSSLQKGKSVTITLSTGESKIVGLADVTGILRTADLMKILP